MPLDQEQNLVVKVAQEGEFTFAAVAWNGYLHQGRGYLYTPLYKEDGVIKTKQVIYIARDSDFGRKARSCTGSQGVFFWQQVDSYPPEQTFILMAGFRGDSGLYEEVWTMCKPSVPPLKVYESALVRPQEFDLVW